MTDDTVQKLKDMQEKVEKARAEEIRRAARFESANETLKKLEAEIEALGYTTVEEAREALRAYRAKADSLVSKVERMLSGQ